MLEHDDMVAMALTDVVAEDAQLPAEKKNEMVNYILNAMEKATRKVCDTEIRENRYTAVKMKNGEVTLFIGTSNAELNEVQRTALKELFEQTKEKIKQIVQ